MDERTELLLVHGAYPPAAIPKGASFKHCNGTMGRGKVLDIVRRSRMLGQPEDASDREASTQPKFPQAR